MWGFRIASRPEAGAGHLGRCLPLAIALGEPAVMFLDPTGPEPIFASRIGFPVRRERANESCDELAAAARCGEVQAAIMDSYAISASDVSALASTTFVAEIDDGTASGRGHLILRPGWNADDKARPASAKVAGGPQLRLIDPVFSDAPIRAPRSVGARRCLLINFGARDSRNATGQVLTALEPILSGFELTTVVLGEIAPHRQALARKYAGHSTVVFSAPSSAAEMKRLYDSHDLAVGGGGVGLAERLAAGIPTVAISIASNQDAGVNAAIAADAAISGGDFQQFDADALRRIVSSCAADGGLRNRISAKGREFVDGLGTARAAHLLHAEFQNWRRSRVSI